MQQIKKFLAVKGVFHEIKEITLDGEHIIIPIELNNIWVNGYGENMYWDRVLVIHQNRYKKYVLGEKTGYSMAMTHIVSGKQKDIINALVKRLKIAGVM